MSDDDARERLRRLRHQVEAHFDAGLERLSRVPSIFSQNISMTRSVDHPYHNRFATGESRDLAEWQEHQSSSVEARLDQCRGGRLEDHHYAWDLFLRRSQYSPLILDQLPKKPRPADLEDDMDPEAFSWVDPFEDLLASSSGLPMVSTRDRYNHRQLWSRLSNGEPADLWLARLHAQRLTEVYFPFREWDYQSPQTMEEWVQFRKNDEEKRVARERETVQRVKEIAQALGFDVKQDVKSGKRSIARPDRDADGQEKEPQSDLDLFDFVRSTAKDVLPPLTAFLKVFSNGKWVTESSTSSTSRTVRTGEDVDEDSLKTTKSSKEWVKGGYVHTKTEIRKTTPDGREVAKETHYSMRPVETEEEAQAQDVDAKEQPGNGKAWNGWSDDDEQEQDRSDNKVWSKNKDGQEEKKNSWLWK